MDVPCWGYGRCMTPEGEPARNRTASNAGFDDARYALVVVWGFVTGFTSFVVLVKAG